VIKTQNASLKEALNELGKKKGKGAPESSSIEKKKRRSNGGDGSQAKEKGGTGAKGESGEACEGGSQLFSWGNALQFYCSETFKENLAV